MWGAQFLLLASRTRYPTTSIRNCQGWNYILLQEDGHQHPILSSLTSFGSTQADFQACKGKLPAPEGSPPSTLILLTWLKEIYQIFYGK